MTNMEFKRIETKRVLAAQKTIKEEADVKRLFEIILKHQMRFTIVIGNLGELKDCTVLSVEDDAVRIYALRPSHTKKRAKFKDILVLEVECNIDFIADESDDDGRWSRIN